MNHNIENGVDITTAGEVAQLTLTRDDRFAAFGRNFDAAIDVEIEVSGDGNNWVSKASYAAVTSFSEDNLPTAALHARIRVTTPTAGTTDTGDFELHSK